MVVERYREQVGNYVIEVKPTLSSGWIIGLYTCTGFIQYDNGGFAFDDPKKAPKYVRRRLPGALKRAKLYYDAKKE